MHVRDAVAARKSIRAYLDTPVETDTLARLLEQAARAPSGGNVQPWRVYVIHGDSMSRFREYFRERAATIGPQGETPEYPVYPPKLEEPYRSSRFKVGEDMYRLLGIAREDKARRLEWFARNYDFFGAPAAFFCYLDRAMGSAQWSDLGMFLQTFMLLAQEEGLDTCAQEAWSRWHTTVSEFVGAGDELMLFCGMSIGYKDPEHPVNQLVTEREPLETWAHFL